MKGETAVYMAKQKSSKAAKTPDAANRPAMKSVVLGPLKERVDRIAARDPVLNTANAVIRQAVDNYVREWDAAHPENPSHA